MPRRLEGLVVEGGGVGAGQAEALAVLFDEAIEVDAFAATGAGYTLTFVAGEFAGGRGTRTHSMEKSSSSGRSR
jgi:hypothetical protein